MSDIDAVKFKTSNLVTGVFFEQNFHLGNLYELLPCVPVKNGFVFVAKKKIPFFGIPNCIVSCQSGYETRGIRTTTCFKNTVCIDFQNEIKNIHIKITSNKFHITGVQSYEMVIETTKNCLRFLVQVDEMWKKFFMLDTDTRILICQVSFNLLKNGDEMLMFDNEEIYSRFENIPQDLQIYSDIILQIISFSYDYPNLSLFATKVDKILNLQPCKHSMIHNGEKISVIKLKVYNGIYNYKFNFNFYLPDFSNSIRSRGYIVDYHNYSKPTSVSVALRADTEMEEDTDGESIASPPSKSKTIPKHLFIINTNGSVRQTSPTHPDVAFEKFSRLCKDVFEIVSPETSNDNIEIEDDYDEECEL